MKLMLQHESDKPLLDLIQYEVLFWEAITFKKGCFDFFFIWGGPCIIQVSVVCMCVCVYVCDT